MELKTPDTKYTKGKLLQITKRGAKKGILLMQKAHIYRLLFEFNM